MDFLWGGVDGCYRYRAVVIVCRGSERFTVGCRYTCLLRSGNPVVIMSLGTMVVVS